MQNFFAIISLSISALALSCCSPIGNTTKVSNESRSYKIPRNYKQHRAQQRKFETKSGEYAYTDHGAKDAKQTIVMLHGVPTNSWTYRKLIPSLQKQHRVITIDLLGYGSSAKPKNNGSNYTPQNQARNVRNLLKSINANNYTLMMHDMGGLVAWEMLRQDSGSVSNLVILNTIVTEKGFNHPKMKAGAMTKLITDAYSMPISSSAILTMTFRHMGLTGADKLSSGACKGYITPLKEGSNDALYAFFTSLNPTLYAHLASHKSTLNNYKGKTLVLWGAEDKNLTTEQIPYLKRHLRIPSNNIHIYPNGSHLLSEEMPKEITRQVTQFLN